MRSKENPNQIPTQFFSEKIMKHRDKLAQAILNNENKAGGIIIPDLKT